MIPLLAFLVPALILGVSGRGLLDPHTSKPCALALLAAGLGALFNAVGRFALDEGAGRGTALFAAAAFILGGALLAAAGLVHIMRRQARSRSAVKGAAHAGGALALAALFGALGGFYGLADHGVPPEWKTAQASPGTRLSMLNDGFSYAVPGPGWTQVHARKLDPQADLAFVHEKDRISFMVVAAPLEGGALSSPDRLLEAACGEILRKDPKAVINITGPETVGTASGQGFVADAVVDGRLLTYHGWVTESTTYRYSLLTFGPRKVRARILSAGGELRPGFAVIKP